MSMNPSFKLLSDVRNIETIASGRGVHIRRYLERTHGRGRWRKMKGVATVELADGTIGEAEIHWFEAHGIGRKDFKIKTDAAMSEFVICIDNREQSGKPDRREGVPPVTGCQKRSRTACSALSTKTSSEPDGYLYPASMFVARGTAGRGKAGIDGGRKLSR